jgi:hypothetical protein
MTRLRVLGRADGRVVVDRDLGGAERAVVDAMLAPGAVNRLLQDAA